MRTSRTLGLVMITPAAVMIVLFFLMPVVLTAIFAMTNPSEKADLVEHKGFQIRLSPNGLEWMAFVAQLEQRPTLAFGVARQQLIIDGVATDPGQPVLRRLAEELHRHHLGAGQ